MREILFKAKRLDGEWVEGYPVYDRADCTLKRQGKCQCAHDGSLITFFGWIDNLHEYDEVEVDPSTVCQYTGLTDRNGKKIFEGDNVYDPHENSIYTVEWNENNAIFQMAHDWRRRSVETAYYCEIIGNIHDGESGQ